MQASPLDDRAHTAQDSLILTTDAYPDTMATIMFSVLPAPQEER